MYLICTCGHWCDVVIMLDFIDATNIIQMQMNLTNSHFDYSLYYWWSRCCDKNYKETKFNFNIEILDVCKFMSIKCH